MMIRSLQLFANAVLATVACVATSEARAAAVSELLDEPVQNLHGEALGAVDDFIVDVRAGRVLYVVVEGPDRFYTLPVRAFDERLRLNMDLAHAAARDKTPDQEPKFRRAARLIGQPVTQPGGGQIGTIDDIQFDADSGWVERVVVSTDQGKRNLPASVLAHGRFPPLTRWQTEHPTPEAEQGFIRRPPSDARNRLHDPKW